MGAGVALRSKQLYPTNFTRYKVACLSGELSPGVLLSFQCGDKLIVNLPTKRHWSNSSLLADIELGLQALASELVNYNLTNCALPALGCGYGELPWSKVKQLIYDKFSTSNLCIYLYPPRLRGFMPNANSKVRMLVVPNGSTVDLDLFRKEYQLEEDLPIVQITKKEDYQQIALPHYNQLTKEGIELISFADDELPVNPTTPKIDKKKLVLVQLLSNPHFLASAPPKVIEAKRAALAALEGNT